jgi:hypothetical protein
MSGESPLRVLEAPPMVVDDINHWLNAAAPAKAEAE